MRTIAAFVLASLALASPAAADWTEIRTPHFLFVGDARAGDMKRIAQRFEQFHSVMQRLLSRTAVSFAVPTVVIVFKDENGFRPYMPLYEGKPVPVAGYAQSASDINYVAMNAAGGEDAYPTVFHELAHLIHHNVSNNPAAWFSEGIAEYYSTFDLRSPSEVRLGLPIGRHLQLLQERLMPLDEFFAVDRTSRTYNDSDRRSLFYAQSWGLIHFLRMNKETQTRFGEYVTLADRGVPQAEAFQQAFGMDLPTLDKALRTYVRRFINYELWTLGQAITDAQLTPATVNEATVLPHLAALLIRQERLDEAESRLKVAMTKSPRSATANAMLATLRLRQNKPADAIAALRQDLEFKGFLDDYLVASTIAHYLAASGVGRPDDAVTAMLRQHAVAATEARDDVPEAWRLAAYAHLLDDDVDDAQRAIARAIVLAPANEYFRFTQAETHVQKHEFEQARAILGPLMGHGKSQDIRTHARRMMGDVVTYEQKYKRAMQSDPEPEKAEPAEAPEPEEEKTEEPPSSKASPSPSTQLPRRFTPIFRETGKDETRVFGKLTAVECGSNGVTVVVNVGARVVRVNAPSFDQYDFITYRPDLKGGVKCGPRTPPDTVFVTWRGADTATGEVKSDAIAVEFTPLGYKQ
jgi:tetratricopeptide (TPR) repeat protein